MMEDHSAIETAEPGSTMSFRAVHNLEAEAALLGAMMSDNRIIDPVADRTRTEDFYVPVHARIFAALVLANCQGRAATPVTLKPMFDQDDGLKELGGISYLARLSGNYLGSGSWRELAAQVAELATLRRMQVGLITAAEACSEAAANPGGFVEAVKEIVEHADAAIETNTSDPIIQVTAAEALDGWIRGLDNPHGGVECRAIPELDKVLGPIRPKNLVILAARPGMGKTAVGISYAIGAAKAGHGVLLISLEMSADEIAGRMAADWCFTHGDNSVPYAAISHRNLNDYQRSRVTAACGSMVQLPLSIVDTGQLTLGRLNSLVKRQARRFAAKGSKLELVIVDYLQLMRAGPRNLSKYEDVSEVSNGLKRIAKEHEVGVMALCQLSREVEKRPDKRPILADLRDSGSIEQDADSVMFLLRPEYYLEQTKPSEASPKFPAWQESMDDAAGKIEFIAAKRRNGRTGVSTGTFYGSYQAVR